MVLATLATLPSPAFAEATGSRTDGSLDGTLGDSSNSDSEMILTVLGIVTVAGALGATFGLYKTTANANDADRVAEAYLRRHAVQLRQDLCFGRGPLMSLLTAALKLDAKQRGLFLRNARLRRWRLLKLADPRTLTPKRARKFFVQLASLVPKRSPRKA